MAIATTQQDIVSLLTADHEEVKKLLKRLQDTKGQAAKRLFGEIRDALQVHSKVEEEIVYPEYRRCVGNSDAKVMVQESLTEHNLVDRVLQEMEELQPSSPEFQGKATVLKELVEHHAKDEEKEMFPKLRKECSQQKLQQLAERVENRKQELQDVPTAGFGSAARSGGKRAGGASRQGRSGGATGQGRSGSRSGSAKNQPSRSTSSGGSRSSGNRGGQGGGQTKQELYQEAKKAGIEGRSQMDKDELQRALKRR